MFSFTLNSFILALTSSNINECDMNLLVNKIAYLFAKLRKKKDKSYSFYEKKCYFSFFLHFRPYYVESIILKKAIFFVTLHPNERQEVVKSII